MSTRTPQTIRAHADQVLLEEHAKAGRIWANATAKATDELNKSRSEAYAKHSAAFVEAKKLENA